MELNALHNILIRVEGLHDKGLISAHDYRYIALQAELFKRYCRALEKNPNLKWAEVIASPEDYK